MEQIRRDLARIQKGYERWSRITFWILAGLIVTTIAGAAASTYLWKQQKDLSEQNRLTLCTFKTDLDQRIAQGERFLRTHSDGFAGLSQSDIRIQITSLKRTRASFAELEC